MAVWIFHRWMKTEKVVYLVHLISPSLFSIWFQSKALAMKMGVFQVVQKSFESMGISPCRNPINNKTLTIMFISFSGISLLGLYVSLIANSAQEYVKCIYILTATVGTFLSAVTTLLTKSKLFSFIGRIDNVFNERKLTASISRASLPGGLHIY